jgi:MFS family permease
VRDAVSFGVSAISIARIRLPRRSTPAGPAANVRFQGFRFLFAEPRLLAVTVFAASFAFLNAGAGDLFVFHLKSDLARSDDDVGLTFSAASLGGVVAGLLASRLRVRFGFGAAYLGGGACMAMALAGLALSGSASVVVALAIAYFFGLTLRDTLSVSLRQEITPEELLGRVTASFWLVLLAAVPVGAAAATALAARVGAPAALGSMGALAAVLAASALFTPLGMLERGGKAKAAPQSDAVTKL